MKKIILGIAGFLMLLAFSAPAMAQDDTQNSMNQNYSDQGYNQQYDQNNGYQYNMPYYLRHQASGYIGYTAYSNTQRHLYFNIRQNPRYYGPQYNNYDDSYNNNNYYNMPSSYYAGVLRYWDDDGNWYIVSIRNVRFSGKNVYFSGPVISGNVGTGSWLFAKAHDGYGYGNDLIWGSFTDRDSALQGVANMTNPADGPFQATSGYITVR